MPNSVYSYQNLLRFLFFLSLFVYFEVGRGGAERERERGRERIPSNLYTDIMEPDAGFELMKCEIMT